ncbi:amino acid permease [Saccharibacillus sp. CPCC 101409]|uniref:amino acid permease n=1 Tax=Saccharibacillus sp. CPCC 101409 TaxID=3058041 RepID=UPI002671A3F0|nr:amino acid permease [Saccharibacillus sp. CPCC 101409]MDO3408316.1 amino acid permease [Saccharibacillus sp. CPCC 101409]
MPQAVALYIGAVLGSGVLIVPGLAAQEAGPASLIAWGLMALLIIPMALSMGLLSAAYPSAGGVSHFVTLAFGRRAGALTGWFFLLSVPIGAPVAALTGAGYLAEAAGWGEPARIGTAAIVLLAGLLINAVGMKTAGRVQVAVVVAIVLVLLLAVAAAVPQIRFENLRPFAPHGWLSVGHAASMLFWCFIGWEAVAHLSEEFKDPRRAAVRGVGIAAVIVGGLYAATAFAVVASGSYIGSGADTALVRMTGGALGPAGALVLGLTGLFICAATIVAYVGAASRVAYALSRSGEAPRRMGARSARYGTPTGGIAFLAVCFAIVLALYAGGLLSLNALIRLPNATFILTYLAGCAAGIRLLRGSRTGFAVSLISFAVMALVFPFTGWAMLYPAGILLGFAALRRLNRNRHRANHEN